MSINTTKLLSGRVPVVPYANLSATRYEFLAVGEAEPNLGAGADNSILTISTNNTRVWSNSITLSSVSVSGNITGGNLLTGGLISATGNVLGGNIKTSGLVSATGNVSGNFILGNGSQLTGIITSVSNVVNGGSNLNIATANANVTVSVSTIGNVAVFAPTGASILGNVAVSAAISATGNIYTAGYFVGTFAGNISGNLTVPGSNTQVLYNNSGNAGASTGFTFNQATNAMSVSGNTFSGNILTSGLVSATGNVTGNYILGNGSQLTGVITSVDANSLIGNTLSSNVIFSSLTTLGTLANLSVSGNTTLANITVVDTTLSSTGNLIAFAGNSGIVLPSGNTAQRPVSPPTGTTRFNSTIDSTETYDGVQWVAGGNVIAPGSISNQQITPDGTSNTFTLNQESTTSSVLVSINGVWQQPTVAYNVTGNSITFNQTPFNADIIDIRFISYLTEVSYLTNSAGNSAINVSPSGNILFTTANNTFATMTDSYFNINYPVSAAGNVTVGGLLTSPQQTKASNAVGTAGQICWDSNYIYVCTATNTWKRTALTGGY
jgi:sRNA-binding regulator protein Hfq